ncbi:MAG: TonB family protein [Betaproteobacteria bacterium]|nr:MAG: TonB family protein [Betaproteobacteria bacterium]
MSYAVQKDSSRRLTGLVAVVAFHVVLVYALVHGLARKIVEVVRQPLETKIIEEIKAPPPDKPPPPPPPKLTTPPPPYIPPPEVTVQVPVSAPTISAVTSVKPPEEYRTPAVVDANTCEKPAYPAAARRANETGIVRLTFLIDVDGKVLASKVERTSGSRRLDEAARAGLSLCKFKPATLNGRPERTWGRIDYVWKLE